MTQAVTISFAAYGGPEVLVPTEADVPDPGPSQVRVATRFSGVNPVDWKIRSGAMQSAFALTLPHVPGAEFSGLVEAVGDGVTGLRSGDAVFGLASGTYATRILATAVDLQRKPDDLSWEQAASLSVAAETAFRALEELRVTSGESLLVHGGAGSVGSMAVRFARARGIRVIASARRERHDYLGSLGATAVVDPSDAGQVDAALDAAGNDALAALIAVTGGRERVLTLANAPRAAEHGVRYSRGNSATYLAPALKLALALYSEGVPQLPVNRAFPLRGAADAHRLGEKGRLNSKMVLRAN